MPISFGESLSNNETPVAETDEFVKVDSYDSTWYPEYDDIDVSTISVNKIVKLQPNQPNLTQETNSQFIPFEMPRYYDGIDLTEMVIQIHFVNANDEEYYASAINVKANSTTLRFGWLVDQRVTSYIGKVKFEIYISGANNYGMVYIWKSKTNDSLTVEASLSGNGVVQPVDYNDWYQSFVMSIDAKIASIQTARVDALGAAERAELAANTINVTAAALNSLAARVDEFATLEEGSTTGDAELMDIRIAADGSVYQNAGTAVREQVSQLTQRIDQLTASYDTLTETLELHING